MYQLKHSRNHADAECASHMIFWGTHRKRAEFCGNKQTRSHSTLYTDSDVNKTFFVKTKTKTKTLGLKTKTKTSIFFQDQDQDQDFTRTTEQVTIIMVTKWTKQ